jgi:hypothetical protein
MVVQTDFWCPHVVLKVMQGLYKKNGDLIMTLGKGAQGNNTLIEKNKLL